MDPPFLLLAFAAVAVLVLVAAMARRAPSTEYRPPAFDRRPLFTAAERSFLGVLDRAVDGRLRVLGKVRLADLVKVRSGLSRSEATTATNKIRMKHVDFVLCSPTDLSVCAVVELDDQSHETRGPRDAFVDEVLASAGIPVHRFSAKVAYPVGDVRKVLGPCASASDAMPTEGLEPSTSPSMEVGRVVQVDASEASAPADATPPSASEIVCPTCGRELVERVAKRGTRAGKPFIGCSGYPDCRYTAPA